MTSEVLHWIDSWRKCNPGCAFQEWYHVSNQHGRSAHNLLAGKSRHCCSFLQPARVPGKTNVPAWFRRFPGNQFKRMWKKRTGCHQYRISFDWYSSFIHEWRSWGKAAELNTIKNGGIWYKKADVHSVSVNVIGNTAILLNNITLLALVGENEVTNLFIVTEVYINEEGKWMLGSLSFTKQLTPGDIKH